MSFPNDCKRLAVTSLSENINTKTQRSNFFRESNNTRIYRIKSIFFSVTLLPRKETLSTALMR